VLQKQIILNEARNVTLTGYLLGLGGEFKDVTKRPAVLVLPGGAYQYCSDREADPVALAYLEKGFHAFVLRYSVRKNSAWPNPLEDYEQAISLIRENAEEWGVYPDKIAVVGFSAGGHLAACAATMSRNRPNAAILGYAVAGEHVKGCCPSAPDAIAAVSADTCPCFVFATRNDRVVPIENSLRFTLALAENDVSFESHIYAYGPHGFSVCNSAVQDVSECCSRVPNWVGDSVEWLKDIFGDFCPEGLSAPRCGAHASADHDPFLSIDCTYGYLKRHPATSELMASLEAQAADGQTKPGDMDNGKSAGDLMDRMTLRDLFAYTSFPEELINGVNETLNSIPNK